MFKVTNLVFVSCQKLEHHALQTKLEQYAKVLVYLLVFFKWKQRFIFQTWWLQLSDDISVDL